MPDTPCKPITAVHKHFLPSSTTGGAGGGAGTLWEAHCSPSQICGYHNPFSRWGPVGRGDGGIWAGGWRDMGGRMGDIVGGGVCVQVAARERRGCDHALGLSQMLHCQANRSAALGEVEGKGKGDWTIVRAPELLSQLSQMLH